MIGKNKKSSIIYFALLLLFIICLLSIFLFYFNNSASPSAIWVKKCFVYDLDNQYWHYPPVEGLEVGFGMGDQLLWTKTTSDKGCVCFGSGLPNGDYWLNYTWGGEPYNETITVDSTAIIHEFTNYLPAKDGGGKTSLNSLWLNPIA